MPRPDAPSGSPFDWSPPDGEVFRLATDEVRTAGVHLLGRRLYESMLYWETTVQSPSLDFSTVEFAALWKALPKVVFSTTLSAVQGNARLATGGLAEEIARLQAEPGEGDIAIGGATLAAEVAACRPFLQEQIRVVAPRVIVTLGAFATHAVLGTEEPIAQLRGRWQNAHGARVMPTFHPAFVLRSPKVGRQAVWADMQLVRDYLAGGGG